MYSMDSFTTSPIPLNCDKILRVSPCTFRAPQWHLRSLIVLLILCKTKKTQIIVIILLKKSIQRPKIRSFVWKKLSFFTLKDLPASQKTEIVHEKMTKNWQKRYQKEHPPPQKPEVLHEKMTKNGQKRYQKEHPAPQKPEVLHEKLKIVLPMGILKKKISTPNFTKFLNP